MTPKIPVFLPSDDNYAPFVATTMASILANTKAHVDFYVLDSGIMPNNEKKIRQVKGDYSIEFLKVDVDKYFKGFNVPSYLNLSIYLRLLIPLLKPSLGKVLYIDTDVVVLGDIEKLFQTNLEGYAIGAAWNPSRYLYNTDTKGPLELSENCKYFNAGVLLMDTQKWMKDEIVKHLFDIQKKYGDKILHADETLLNKYFDNDYKIFDVAWNYTDYDVVNSPDVKPLIRHFATPMKPWRSNYQMVGNKVMSLANFDDFWFYAEMTPFYDEIKKMYDVAINKTPLAKRMSAIADRMRKLNDEN